MRTIGLLALVLAGLGSANGEEIKIFNDTYTLQTPKGWKTVKPKTRIIDKEYSVAKEGVEGAARVTLMAAGGSIDANISRWISQFSKPGGGSVRETAKIEQREAGDAVVHQILLEGTYKESVGGGPFFGGKSVMRENYQMLSAIIVFEGRKYFIKMTGPKAIVTDNKDAFKKMLSVIK